VAGTANDPKSTQWAVGYEHSLSKRTNLYVAYADISNKRGGNASVGDSSNGGAGYQNGFNLGIRHRF
jgi:predicted porin